MTKSREILVTIGFVVMCIVFTFLSSMMISSIAIIIKLESIGNFLSRIGQLLGILSFFIVWYKKITIFETFDLPLYAPKMIRHLWLALSGAILGLLSLSVIFLIYIGNNAEYQFNDNGVIHWFAISLIPAIIVHFCVGVSEELLFRGYILSKVEQITTFTVANAVQSILFSLTHWFNFGFNWKAFVGLVLFGWLMAYLRILSRSLWLPVGFHALWNISQGSIFGFAVSGAVEKNSLIRVHIGGSEWWSGGAFGPEAGIVSMIWLFLLILIFGFVLWIQSNKASVVSSGKSMKGERVEGV
ncbi:CPBP family intramembrane glutamic endopeptidase [Anoxybacteroides amylolyticum]|uniref:CAAX protease self-immunity family protein n=1 Tax=Anoxybacteroides amylolyticum TaxID=294699 RepID=A0A160F6K6_9BACL|nr:type II CAAX endopeptidase family protein [Anoxybacillus amylolyticus]ANB62249.1 CAAX protease self-immunity family protein [Anoxybacillus amylolyticus]